MIRPLAFAALVAAASTGLSTAAFAHAHLHAAVPADKASVKTAPTELDLTFTEGLNLKFSGVTVTGPGKAAVKTGEAMLMDGDKTLMVPITAPLPAGQYTVDWHVLSVDGHKSEGSYSFTVAP